MSYENLRTLLGQGSSIDFVKAISKDGREEYVKSSSGEQITIPVHLPIDMDTLPIYGGGVLVVLLLLILFIRGTQET